MFLFKRHESRLPTPRTNPNRAPSNNQFLNTTQTFPNAAGENNTISNSHKSPSVANRNLQLTKPPIAPSMQHPHAPSSQTQNGGGQTTKTGRTLMSYGGQRSATTSIVTSTNSNLQQPQPRMTTLQKQFAKQQQMQPPQLPSSGPNGYHHNNGYFDYRYHILYTTSYLKKKKHA